MDIDKAKLKALAEATKGWDYMTGCWPEEVEDGKEATGNWCVGQVNEDDDKSQVLTVNTAQWDAEDGAQKLAEYYAAANAPAILALLAENKSLIELLREMTCAYHTALSNGHERIVFLGGDCDSVEKMEHDFPAYRKARALLAAN